MKDFILKGTIVYSDLNKELNELNNGYVVCVNGRCQGVFDVLPPIYNNLEIIDEGNKLIIPGMSDLHLHAPQYTFRGMSMDKELLDWLNTYTFPEEAKYIDSHYAYAAYSVFTKRLKESYTTRACIFATLHKDATLELMKQLDETGLKTYVGKVNMDRNSPKYLCEETKDSILNTNKWIAACEFKNTKPIITPRFIPSCSDELMKELGKMATEMDLRIQSHLSENPSEIEWVHELVPESNGYGDAYRLFNALGDIKHPAIMAHCVYSNDDEMSLLKQHGTYVAHCPESNLNLASGIAPIRKMMEMGVNVGLGSDVAGGTSLNMFKQITLAIQSSKMYWRYNDSNAKPLSFAEAFYLATLGGGSYFGQVGSFLKGYEFDALVIDDHKLDNVRKLSGIERLERCAYENDLIKLKAKYVSGNQII